MNGPGSFGAGEPAYVVPVPTQGPYLTRKMASDDASHEMLSVNTSFIVTGENSEIRKNSKGAHQVIFSLFARQRIMG